MSMEQVMEIMRNPQMRSILSCGNPQQAIQNLLANSQNSPMLNSIMQSLKSGDVEGAKNKVRNVGRQQGLDIDQIIMVLDSVVKK